MDSHMIYKTLYEQAIQKIYMIRSPKPERLEVQDTGWQEVKEQEMFNFGDKSFYKYSELINAARTISTECFFHIVINLYKAYGIPFEIVKNEKNTIPKSPTLLTIVDRKTNTLFQFKNIEESSFWIHKGITPDSNILNKYNVSSIKTIYLVFENAEKQIIRKNHPSNLGAEYDIYSVKWFFENCFSANEYSVFKRYTDIYIDYINKIIGFILMRSLNPNTFANFKKSLENSIIQFDYSSILSTVVFSKYILEQVDYDLLSEYFFGNSYLILLGKNNCAESLVTAEWLYRSLKKASAIDLTSIGMGYFKAVEQLLYDIICLHKNEKRTIHKDNSKKYLPVEIELNDENINNKNIDTSIGSMANFCKKNKSDIFLNKLSPKAKTYIVESIFRYKDLRNGHLHKDNIHDWTIIETIRNASYQLFFLLLGGVSITDSDKTILGQDDYSYYSDYYKLCEFVNYYSDNLFFLKKDEQEFLYLSVSDPYAHRIENGHVKYSGIYFRNFEKNAKPFLIHENELPDEIQLGKLDFGDGEKIELNPQKVKKIFANGKFIGPRIFEENTIDF